MSIRKYMVCSCYSLHAGSFYPSSQMIKTSPSFQTSLVSVFKHNTASSGSASHALPSVQSQTSSAPGGSSLHPDCLLKKHLIPMQEHTYII